jgi:predicted SAM-dependent methyltransferase
MLGSVKRLNLGCGPCVAPGWINADQRPGDGIDLAGDIRSGLPLDTDSIDYIAAIHVLQDLSFLDIPPLLAELKRILKPCGVIRLAVPDLDRAIRAYLAGDHGYFYVPDTDARRIGTKLVAQIIWYGSVRTPMTFDCLQELLSNKGFANIRRCPFGQTGSRYPEIVQLDNRPRESLFVEAMKPEVHP